MLLFYYGQRLFLERVRNKKKCRSERQRIFREGMTYEEFGERLVQLFLVIRPILDVHPRQAELLVHEIETAIVASINWMRKRSFRKVKAHSRENDGKQTHWSSIALSLVI